jgi:uncharacterized damage-inducible protein DinB
MRDSRRQAIVSTFLLKSLAMRDLLIDTIAHMPPKQVLDGLSGEDAARKPAGAPHSIAEVVAHAHFWQRWWLARCQGVGEPIVTSAAAGWPAAGSEGWETLRGEFLDVLARLAAIAEDPAALDVPITPAIEFPPLAYHTVRDGLVHVATHNAHHLGQVILLRQLIGVWPPPGGSYTW